MAKDRTPGDRGTGGTARGGSSSAGKGASAAGGRARSRPPTQVVTQGRPWGLIAAAVAVVVFAVAAIGYALVQVNRAEADAIESPDEIDGVEAYEYEAGQHVGSPVQYTENPPVGGEHDPQWADCTGTVYDVDIRHENAVHSLEHGAVWITYNPDEVSDADIEALGELVDGESGRMLSPYVGQDSPVSAQSWGHQLKVDSATDERLEQYADFFTLNPEYHPEPGATCDAPAWLTDPLLEESDGQAPADGSSTPAPSSTAPSTPAEPSETATR